MSQQQPPHPFQPPTTQQRIHQAQQPSMGTNTDATGGVVPCKNPLALTGYYLAVFSLIPILGLALGIAAIIYGTLGYSAYQKEPRKRGQAHAWVAIILGSLTTPANIILLTEIFSGLGNLLPILNYLTL